MINFIETSIMSRLLNLNRVILILLAAAVIAAFPAIFFCNLAVLAVLMKFFLIICVLDFIRKTSWRKPAGTVLALFFLAEIVSGLILLIL